MPRSAASSSVASPASPASSLRVAALPFALPLDGVTDQLAQAARAGIGLAVFPEMSLLGTKRVDRLRRAELETLAEPMDGRSLGIVTDAVEATGVAAGVGLLERGPDGAIYNSYVVCMPGGTKHRHRKVYATENPHLQGGAALSSRRARACRIRLRRPLSILSWLVEASRGSGSARGGPSSIAR